MTVDTLDHDQGADDGGDHAGGGLGSAGEVVEPVPDGDQQDAAAGLVI
jgi:hypothetical protein